MRCDLYGVAGRGPLAAFARQVKTARDLLPQGLSAYTARGKARFARTAHSHLSTRRTASDIMQFFRNFFKSKIGLGITLLFLGLIAIAFASSDVASTGTFGGVAGGSRVAVVGDTKIGTGDLSRAASTAVDRVRQDNPTISMQAFVADGGLESVLEQLINRTAIREYGEMFGLRAGDNLVNSEIIAIPAFRGAAGNFDEETYRAAIAQQGMTDAQVRDDLGSGLIAQQLLVPASFGAQVPQKIARRYASLIGERREGFIGFLPSAAFAPEGNPSAAQLQSYYEANRADYIRPERRVIRYATFGSDQIDDNIEPTDAEIAARYRRDRAQYAASEERTYTQVIVPTQEAANALRTRVQGGSSFDQVAREAGFETTELGPATQASLAAESSAQVAQAVFAASRGGMAAPARSPLGWHVVRVDSVDRSEGRTLAQARTEIVDVIRQEKRNAALSDLSAQVEERLDDGEALSDVARSLGLQLQTTRPVTADGQVYGREGQTAPELLAPAFATAFQMEESEPQLAVLERGQEFLLFEASDITQSATAPLNEIRDRVQADWRIAQGLAAARKAADSVLGRMGGDTSLASAFGALKTRVPAPESVQLTRQQLAQQSQNGVPAPLALFFSMAQGTTKKLEAPGNLGWFVVSLDDVSVGRLAADDPMIEGTRRQLAQTVGQEYAEQLQAAMRDALEVETNPDGIDAVRRQLTGEN